MPAVLTAMGLAVSFSGVMYARLGERVPRAKAFDDIARAAYGRWGTMLSYCTVYVAIFAVPALLHLTSAESLLQIFAPQGLTRVQANIVIALIIIPLSQVGQLAASLMLWHQAHMHASGSRVICLQATTCDPFAACSCKSSLAAGADLLHATCVQGVT